MSTNGLQPGFRLPSHIVDEKKYPEISSALRQHDNGIVDLNQAIVSLKSQIDNLKPSVPTKTSAGGSSTTIVVNGSNFPGLGGVRDLTGLTAYTNIGSDNGILLLLNDASPIAVTLDSAMVTPYFLSATNLGAGSATFTPSSGTINGTASFTLPQNYTSILVFDGTNWVATALLVLPQSAGPTLHEWLASYDSATGVFTLSQPDYSDLTGTPQLPNTLTPVAGEYLTGYDSTTGNFSQSTTPGISATIVTAALTPGGTQGSQTFVDGILTAQTPAT